MKYLNIKLPFTINDLLNFFDLLGTNDLQRAANKIDNLLNKRKKPNDENQEKVLLGIIKQKLPNAFLERFELLKLKIQEGTLSKTEKLELEAYVAEIEEFDTKKINALNQLAKLKNVSFQKLANDLNAFPQKHE